MQENDKNASNSGAKAAAGVSDYAQKKLSFDATAMAAA
jgi:hypothetical protein